MFGRRGVAVFLGCALGLAACSGGATLISAHLGTPEAISQQHGLTMYTATKVWHDEPKDLPNVATPVAVELRNDGQSEVQLLLSDFVLVDDRGRKYRPLSAYLKPPPPPSELPKVKGPRDNGFNPFAPQLGETWTADADQAIRDRARRTTRADHTDDDPSHRQLGETWHGAERAVDPELEKLELTVTERTAANVPKTQEEAIAEINRRRGTGGARPVTSGPPSRSNTAPKVVEFDAKQRFAKPSKIKYGEVPEEVVAKKVNNRAELARFREGPPPAFRIGDIKGFGYGFRAGLFVEQGEKSADHTDAVHNLGGITVRDPDWYNRPFYYAPGLRLFYWEGGRDLVFANRVSYPTDYWQRVGKIDAVYRGTLDHLQHVALPEGVLPPRAAAAGYLYFGKLPEDVREVHIYWDPKSSATQRQLARLSVSYRRR
jgi:hypothetical protein